MGETRRKYSAEFKQEAVRLVTEYGYTIAEAARNLGIDERLVGRWKKELERDGEGAFPGKGHIKPEEEELRRLRDEIKRLKMEREILKKAAAFFARESG
jgi:transposase